MVPVDFSFLEAFFDEAAQLYAELAESGVLTPAVLIFLVSTVAGIIKTGIKFLLFAAIALFVLTSLGIVAL